MGGEKFLKRLLEIANKRIREVIISLFPLPRPENRGY